MKLYEIDQAIAQLIEGSVDPETGELVLDYEALDKLQTARTEKCENIALMIKNKTAEVKAIDEEIKKLNARKQSGTREIDSLKSYLLWALNGQKLETARVACSFRKSQKVTVEEDFLSWAIRHDKSLLREKDPEPNKTEIGKRLKDGDEIPFTSLEESVSVIIR